MNTLQLHHGDCLEVMRAMPSNSVDSIVTDPPYGLSFMGKKWDYDVPSVDVWAECLRVLKPGGHLLAFAGTRTQHRMAVRIEDAGFEIRDMIAWVYGSGFPKSLDVSKAIDKARRRDYVQVALDMGLNLPGRNVDDWTKEGHAPGDKWWSEFKAALPPETWQAIERRVIGSAVSGQSAWFARGVGDVTAPATDAARQWQGWGTALKPALEPITMARKPLIGTVAANVLAHGTGGLNIDGCRVGDFQNTTPSGVDRRNAALAEAGYRPGTYQMGDKTPDTPPGRWPANLIHDGSSDVVAAFPDSNGSGPARKLNRSAKPEQQGWGMNTTASDVASLRDAGTGSAARFFYAAKASKKDRDEGLDGHETVIIERSLTSESPKWENADQQVVLQVDTEPSPPKVIAVSGVSNKSAHEWSTLLFGSEHTAPCLQGTTCIIETPTSSTTGLTTLSYFQNLLTSANTQVANYETESGGSPAQTAAPGTLLLRTTSGMMASALGVEHAASPTLLKISVSARRSDHPTVKPTDLMAYLCRLVTPPGGLVLDPFMGSGSTGKAAVREGFSFIGIEREADYLRIATARIEAQMCTSRAKHEPPPQNDLFSQSLRA